MAKRKRKIKDIVYDIYRDLYMHSTPQADFDDLVANADILQDGRKDIHYEDYEIGEDTMSRIVERHINLYSLKQFEKESIRINVYLGCSPKTRKENE